MSIFASVTLLTAVVSAPQACYHTLPAFLTWLTLWAILVRYAHRSETR